MPLKNCVGCNQELWWFTDKPPICRNCAGDPAPIIQGLREQVRQLTQRPADCANCHANNWVTAGFPVSKEYCGNCGASR